MNLALYHFSQYNTKFVRNFILSYGVLMPLVVAHRLCDGVGGCELSAGQLMCWGFVTKFWADRESSHTIPTTAISSGGSLIADNQARVG